MDFSSSRVEERTLASIRTLDKRWAHRHEPSQAVARTQGVPAAIVKSTQNRRFDCAFAGVLLLAAAGLMLFWSTLIAFNTARIEALLAAGVHLESELILGTDPVEYRRYFNRYPTDISHVSEGTLFTEFQIRPLYGPVSSSLALGLGSIFGLKFPQNMVIILSFYATLCTILFAIILRLCRLPGALIATFSFLVTTSFGWLSIFSVPESYSLTTCGALLCLLSGLRFERAAPLKFTDAFGHAALVGVMSWLYLPLAGAAALLLPQVRSLKDIMTKVVPASLVIVGIALLPQLAYGGFSQIEYQVSYAQRWSGLDNIGLENIVSVALGLFLFSIVSPVQSFISSTGQVSVDQLLSSASTLSAVILLILSYIFVFIYMTYNKRTRFAIGSLAWLAALLPFYTYYNPEEVLLFTSLPAALIVYTCALAFVDESKPNVVLACSVSISMLGAVLLYLNLSSLIPL